MTLIYLAEALPDIPRAFTAIAEFLACLLFIIFSNKKYNAVKTTLISILALIILVLFHYVAGLLPIYFWIPCMITAAGLMFLYIYLTCKGSFKLSIYNTITAFIIAEFAAAFEWWQYYFFATNFEFFKTLAGKLSFCVLIYTILFTGFILLERRYGGKEKTSIEWKDLWLNLAAALIVFIVSNISFVDWDTPMTSKYPLEIFYIRALVDFCGVVVLYSAREQRKYNNAKMELAQMHNLLVRQYQQYCVTKGTIDAVNRKYHDLKHQLSLLADCSNDKTKESIASIKEDIKLYEAVYKTGNDVLDTILTSKASICVEKKINLTCIADGKILGFMNDMDICSLFGNALDNSIEGTEKIKDLDKRVINVKLYQQNMFMMVIFENYYEGNLLYEDGELQSTKKNKLNHGYGVKSIRSIVEKYGGKLQINTEDHWFIINVMIPIEQ